MQLLPDEIKRREEVATAGLVRGLGGDECAGIVLDVVPPISRAIRKVMRQHRLAELSVPQFRALGLLSFAPQASLSCVADYIGSSLPAASRMIDGLVAKKLVARKECCHDRRQISLVLTPQGLSAFLESRHAAQRQLTERLAGLSEDKKKGVIEAMRWLGEIFGSDADRIPRELASPNENRS
ncbi:MAG TPA: MarR family transcriptional regulator [Tepidisphaeraceae bacterium]|nr:MarR family transcriptional regulator [Tepidisphaeraceae bacterium]